MNNSVHKLTALLAIAALACSSTLPGKDDTDGGAECGAEKDTGTHSGADGDADSDTDSDVDAECAGGCLIDGVCVPDGFTAPNNTCVKCDTLVSISNWTDNNGQACDDGDFCTVDDVCSSGECNGAVRNCDDGVFCNGEEFCDDTNDSCSHWGNPCAGEQLCLEDKDRCCLPGVPAEPPVCNEEDNSVSRDNCGFEVFLDDCLDPALNGLCQDGACGCIEGLAGEECDRCLIYVDGKNGNDANDGRTWLKAKKTVQAGIDAADDPSDTNDCEVWVSVGTYQPTQGNDREAAFDLRRGVEIYGGFDGHELARGARDLENNRAILSGDLNGDDIPGNLETNKDDNVYHVVKGEDNAVIDGFIIQGGNANGEEKLLYGGGMFNDDTSPLVANCTFQNNLAKHGGGMGNWVSSPTVTNCTFQNNSATGEHGSGGGMKNHVSSPTVTNCTFQDNSATDGGGMGNHSSSTTIISCLFKDNVAVSSGGGMISEFSSPLVINCTFQGNTASSGGGMYSHSLATPVVTNTVFQGNSAANYGGGIYYDSDPVTAMVTNCVFQGNSANSGGGIYNGRSITVTNSILWGNKAQINGPQININSPKTIIANSDIQGGCTSNTICGDGNIDADPLFVDDDSSDGTIDLRLRPDSPCIDTGSLYHFAVSDLADLDSDEDTSEHLPWDMDRNPRVQGTEIDMGPFETNDAPPTGPSCPIYVKQTGDNASSGESWSDALATVRMGLYRAAQAIVAGDDSDTCEVWVASGTYLPTNDGTHMSTFRLHPGIHLYGGFSGTETSLDQRVLLGSQETILSGDLDDNDVPGDLESNRDDNTYTVVVGANNAALDGFTIAGGEGTGMVNHLSSPTVSRCTFKHNVGSRGGGMHNRGASPILRDCIFQENSAWNGGGMNNNYAYPAMTNCLFQGNSAESHGGGIANWGASSITLTNSTFFGNSAEEGGGMWTGSHSSPVTNCIFWGNSAQTGDQLYSDYSNRSSVSNSNIQDGCESSEGADCGEGNIDADPLFVDDDYSDGTVDLRLTCHDLGTDCSPCIDTGDNDAISGVESDLDGNPRIVGDYIDIGAYEYQL